MTHYFCASLLLLPLFAGCSSSMEHFSSNAPGEKAAAGQESPTRKIIYTARLAIVVDDLTKAEEELNQLLQARGGYIAKSEMRGMAGTPRSGVWTVRVPVEHFRVFLDSVGKLGQVERSTTDSDDITDKYHDLQAHLKNNATEEEGLRKLMIEKSTGGKLEDLITIRREINKLRGEIDAQQGQLKRWDKETSFTTITLEMADSKAYLPKPPPGLRTSMGRTFDDSVQALENVGKWLLLTLIAIVPWLPLVGLSFVAWRWWRRRRTSKNRVTSIPGKQ